MIHIVLYERSTPKGLIFVVYHETFENWEDADLLAKRTAHQYNCRAWVAAIEKPIQI